METKKYYRSHAFYISASNFKELCEKLTEFAKDKFVIAWQIFTKADLKELHCVVTWKLLE